MARRKLLANERVHRLLGKRHAELLPEFERTAETEKV